MVVRPILTILIASDSLKEKEELTQKLAHYLNHLMLHDFSQLVQLLYRIDVDEKKVKAVLQQNPDKDAGNLLAQLLIERQKAKDQNQNVLPSYDSESQEERW
jgi:hypothetical protein